MLNHVFVKLAPFSLAMCGLTFFWQAVMFDVRQCTAIEIWLELEMGKVAGVNTIILRSKPG